MRWIRCRGMQFIHWRMDQNQIQSTSELEVYSVPLTWSAVTMPRINLIATAKDQTAIWKQILINKLRSRVLLNNVYDYNGHHRRKYTRFKPCANFKQKTGLNCLYSMQLFRCANCYWVYWDAYITALRCVSIMILTSQAMDHETLNFQFW